MFISSRDSIAILRSITDNEKNKGYDDIPITYYLNMLHGSENYVSKSDK